MSMQKEAPEAAKETPNKALRHFTRYGGAKTLICRVKGIRRIIDIYVQRGFVEVSEEEYNRIKAEGV